MVARKQKRRTLVLATGLTLLMGAGLAQANDTTSVPMTITLTDMMETIVPLYISVQTKVDYQSMKGQGAILKTTSAGTITETVQLPTAGDYAITIWHDLDNDGRFSMNERYEVLDGWSSSGDASRSATPTFEQSKISVPSYGASATIAMIYPEP